MNWYALQTRSNVEAQVQSLLNLSGFEDFCPRYEMPSENRRTDRAIPLSRVLFPGYVFSRLDISSQEQHHRVLTVPGVIRLVGYGADPVIIEDWQIDSIRILASTRAKVTPEPCYSVNEGDPVRVVKGPFRGAMGCVMYAKSRPRLVISIEMLGQAVSTEVDADWLEPIAPTKKTAV